MVEAGIAGKSGKTGSNGANGADHRSDLDYSEQALAEVLRTHWPAPAPEDPAADEAGPADSAARLARPAALSAACVHTASYGTRSAMIVSVGAAGLPRVLVADGPPCQAPFRDYTGLWAPAARAWPPRSALSRRTWPRAGTRSGR